MKEAAWQAAAAAPGAPDLRAERVATEGGACGRWARSGDEEDAAAAACSATVPSAAAAGGMAGPGPGPPRSCVGDWPSMAGGQDGWDGSG